MDADYGRNRDRDGEPTKAFEPSLYVWATVMSRPAEARAIVDAGLKALAFDSAPPLVCDEPAATCERASDEHGRLAVSAATNRLGLGDKIRLIPGHCDPTVNLYDWYVRLRGNRVEQVWPITAAAPCIDARGRAEHEAGLRGRPSAVRIISTTVDQARFLMDDTFGPKTVIHIARCARGTIRRMHPALIDRSAPRNGSR
jgi:Putative serine dehydratase domain